MAPSPLAAGGPVYLGLTPATWIKIGVLTLLMVALYRFNLARLWAKTNPINGQGNWEHAVFIPLVGLYYLYVWRDELLGTAKPAKPAAGTAGPAGEVWSAPGIWAFLHAVPVLLGMVAVPFLPFFLPRFAVPDFDLLAIAGGLRELRRQLPLVPVAAGAVIFSAAAAGFVFLRRDELQYAKTQRWLTAVWHGLGCWLMAYLLAAGVLFFVGVATSGPALAATWWAVNAALLLALGWVAWAGSDDAWRRRYDRVLASSAGWFGGYVLAWGILFSLYGIWPGQNDFFKDIGMVVALFGLVLLTTDWRVMAVAWFPVVFLFCALPWPDQVYSELAMPLQTMAAKVGVFVLQATGVEAAQTGTKIVFFDADHKPQVLNVEEACAGLKSLMTFVSIGAAIAFLSGRLLWQKLAITFMAIPTAILCNTVRISGQGLLHRYVGEEWSRDFAHGFVGLVLIFPGFGLIWLSAWVVDHLFVEEADEKPAASKAATIVRAKATTGPAAGGPMPAGAPRPAAAALASPAVPAGVVAVAGPAPAGKAAGAGHAGTPVPTGSPAAKPTVLPPRPAGLAPAAPRAVAGPPAQPPVAKVAVAVPRAAAAAPASLQPSTPVAQAPGRPAAGAGAVAPTVTTTRAAAVAPRPAASAARPPQAVTPPAPTAGPKRPPAPRPVAAAPAAGNAPTATPPTEAARD